MYFAVSAEREVKMKDCENFDEYLDFAWQLNKLWNEIYIDANFS